MKQVLIKFHQDGNVTVTELPRSNPPRPSPLPPSSTTTTTTIATTTTTTTTATATTAPPPTTTPTTTTNPTNRPITIAEYMNRWSPSLYPLPDSLHPPPPPAAPAAADDDNDDDDEPSEEDFYPSDFDEEGNFIVSYDQISDAPDRGHFFFFRIKPSIKYKWDGKLREARQQNGISDIEDDETAKFSVDENATMKFIDARNSTDHAANRQLCQLYEKLLEVGECGRFYQDNPLRKAVKLTRLFKKYLDVIVLTTPFATNVDFDQVRDQTRMLLAVQYLHRPGPAALFRENNYLLWENDYLETKISNLEDQVERKNDIIGRLQQSIRRLRIEPTASAVPPRDSPAWEFSQ